MREEVAAWLAGYEADPDALVEALAGLSEAGLNLAASMDTWTIRQIVHHVVDGDDLWTTAIKAALGNGETVFTLSWYWDLPQKQWAESWAYRDRDIDVSLALFRANRAHVLQLLGAIRDAVERTLTVRFPGEEPVVASVGQILGMQTRHVRHHIQEIRAIRELYKH